MIKQIKISPSGCQIWKPQILASATGRFAYASTLAIYVFETKHFQLEKIFTHADQNISAIEWEPQSERYLAQATADKKLVIWEVDSENIKFNVTLPSSANQIEWSKCQQNNILLLLQNGKNLRQFLTGDIKLVDLNSKAVVTIEVLADERPTICRWHPKRESIAAIGYKSGKIAFVDVQTLQTYTMTLQNFEGGDHSSGCIDLQWDQGEDHLLAAFGDGSMTMIDFNGFTDQTQLRFVYDKQSVGMNCLCWRDDKSGDFITSTKKVGALRLWNVAHKEPKQVIKVGANGIHFIKKLKNDSKRILIAFLNGAIQIYNLQKKRVEFQTEAGHAETVFDLEFNPNNRDQIASCSYDGTVRIWDANQMKLLQINDSIRNTPLNKEDKHIIYSVSWSPNDNKIAMVGALGYMMIFDALKGKYLNSIAPAQGQPSFKVDWNQLDDKFILMGSQSGQSYVISLENIKNLKITSSVDHAIGLYGVCWSPSVRDEYIVGCADGSVRLCSMNSSQSLKIMKGHDKRVFNVIYNQQLPHIIASGSDDLTIRVWNKDDSECMKVLKGHSHNVRAIQFNPELPWCLVSGAWDATIKLWDVRSGNCIYTISDHTADVYGISFHPSRPFNFVSSSRDTTLRCWSMDQLVTTIRIQMLLDTNNTKFYDNPQQAFQTKGEYKLSSEDSQKLIKLSQQCTTKNEIQRMQQFYSFLNLNDGQDELFNILELLHNIDFQPHPRLHELKILHCAQIASAMKAFALKLRQATGMSMYNTQFAKKEDRLQEAAKVFLRVGDFKNYCETLFELGQYQKALAFAPAVSIEYWQELAVRQADALEKQNNPDAAIAAIVANQCDRAIELFALEENYEDGKLVKALQLTGVFKSALDSLRSVVQQKDYEMRLQESLESLKTKELFKIDQQLAQFVKDESELFFYQGKPILAAACHLSISDFKSAIITLVRNNELYLAQYISKMFYPQALSETTLLICERAEKYFQSDICIRLLNEIQNERAINLFKRRLMNSGLLKSVPTSQDLEAFQAKAQQSLSQGVYALAVESLILGNNLDQACTVALQAYLKAYENSNKDLCSTMFEVNDIIQQVNISKVNPELRDRVLFYASYAALFKAIWFGLYDVMIAIIQQIQDLAMKINHPDIKLQTFLHGIESAISLKMKQKADYNMKGEALTQINIAFNNDTNMQKKYEAYLNGLKQHMQGTYQSQYLIESVLFSEPGIYLYHSSGQNLQGSKKSAFTHAIIKGSPYTFEDGKTIVSQEEALEWALCNRFSPLNNGYRINPY